jgi:subtilisin family serine protease
MRTSRFRLLTLFLALLLIAAVAASAGGSTPLAKGKPAKAAAKHAPPIDLATYNASRWIVQLRGVPLASYGLGVGRLNGTNNAVSRSARMNVKSARSAAYVSQLKSQQRAFTQRLVRTVRGAKVQRSYQVVLNGLAVKMTKKQAAIVRHMTGVKAVTPDIPYRLNMYATPAQIGAPTLWGQVGGQATAGSGVKVAVIDSGIFVRYDDQGNYTGNPCFNDAGYTAPKGFPKGDKKFTNNKVIVARKYFRPGDPPTDGNDTAIQGPGASPHGTHTAGTVACDANTPITYQGASLTLSGIAPHAYLMNYRVFYPSETSEDFQNGNAYTVELVKAFEDAVKDGANVISNSWGSTYQNTLAWPDPMVQAAEEAVDAGVTVVFSNGNAGPDTDTVGSAGISNKVISVGAVTKTTAIVPGFITVTAPAPVPANLANMPFSGAQFGPQVTTTVGPSVYIPAETVSTATSNKTLGCSLAGDTSPFPAGSLTGKIALIERGTCNFSEKVFNAQRGGAIAVFIYNNAANGESIAVMGAGVHADDVTIPSWLMRRSDGLNTLAFATAHPGTSAAKFDYTPHQSPNAGDVMAGFSSIGPTEDRFLKPDVVAPGVDVVSSGYGVGDFPIPFTGFGSASGTSMAAPHVAGSAALLLQLHPNWTPAQVKSALMTTATEDVWTNSNQNVRASVLARGAGRIDLTKAGTPGLTLDNTSLSAGELVPGQGKDFTIRATDVSGAASTWTISSAKTADGTNFDITPSTGSLAVAANGSASFNVHVGAVAGAARGSYEGKVELTNGATGRVLHMPVWLRVLDTTPVADVLLVDDDGSSVDPDFPDYSQVYKDTFNALGASYQYLDVGSAAFPSLLDLYHYKAVVIFTGNNDSFDTSGFSPADQDHLSEWLDSGGKLWTSGQNFAETSDSNGSFSSASLGRSRLYHGYLGLKYVTGSAYGDAPAPSFTGEGKGPLKKLRIDLSPGHDGAGNQSSIEVSEPMPDTDTYAAKDTMIQLFAAKEIHGNDTGIAWARSSEPGLKDGPDKKNKERQQFLYRSLSMGFGLEGINSDTKFSSRQDVATAAWRWLSDTITFGTISATPRKPGKDETVFTVPVTSSAEAAFTDFAWDFGDGSGIAHSGKTPTANHKYRTSGDYIVRVAATDDLGHTAVTTQTVHIAV